MTTFLSTIVHQWSTNNHSWQSKKKTVPIRNENAVDFLFYYYYQRQLNKFYGKLKIKYKKSVEY
jgi:hypothetical protein